MKHKEFLPAYPLGSVGERFRFNGQETEQAFGLNVTEMDFRQYDAAIGRFHNIDLLAETAPAITPYRFGFNNPVVFNDPSGLREMYVEHREPLMSQVETLWYPTSFNPRAPGRNHWDMGR